MKLSQDFSLIFLRTITALLMIIHGIARISYNIVDDFGIYLAEQGIRYGSLAAWGITIGELTFGAMIVFGFLIRYASLFFIITLISGLFMVHFNEGWFVVGLGRNGMEYSVLLISVFSYLAWYDFKASIANFHNTK